MYPPPRITEGDNPGPQGGGLGQRSTISGLDDLGEPKGWRPDCFVCFFSFPRAFLSEAGATFGPNLPFRGLLRVLMLVVSAVLKVRNVVPCALGRSLKKVELVPERVEPLWEWCSRDSCLNGLLLRRLVGDGSRSRGPGTLLPLCSFRLGRSPVRAEEGRQVADNDVGVAVYRVFQLVGVAVGVLLFGVTLLVVLEADVLEADHGASD